MRRGALRMEKEAWPWLLAQLPVLQALILPLFDYTKIRVIVLQLVRALQSPGGLVKTLVTGPHSRSFVFHRSGAGGWEAEGGGEGFSSLKGLQMLLLLAQVTLRAAPQDKTATTLVTHPTLCLLLLFSATQQVNRSFFHASNYRQRLRYEEAYTGLISKEQVFNNFGRCICFVSLHFY